MDSVLIFSGHERIIGFFLIGAVSSAIDIGLLYYLTEFVGIWYLVSAALSYCCGTLVSYGMNKYLNFHDRNQNYLTQFMTFAAISVSCLMMNLGIIWLAVEMFSVGYLSAKILATLFVFFWNYHGQKTITFRRVTP
jgi:putative flippase GtrA